MHIALVSQTKVEEISPFEFSQSSHVEINFSGVGFVKSIDEAIEHLSFTR